MSLKDYFDKLIVIINKLYYSLVFPILLLCIVFILCISFEKYVVLFLILYTLLIVFWLFKLIYIPENKTSKYGILIVVDNNSFYNEMYRNFFRKIGSTLENDFCVKVFNKNFLRKFNSDNDYDEIMRKKNYHMALKYFSFEGQENSEYVCSLNSNGATVMVPNIDETLINNLQKDFNKSFKRIMKLRDKYSYSDILENTDLLVLSIRYFVSIIYTIFGQLDKAEKELVNMSFDNINPSDRIVQYLRKGMVNRFVDIYFIRTATFIKEQKYLYDDSELEKLAYNYDKLQVYVGSSKDSLGDIRFSTHDFKAKLLFANLDYSESYKILNMLHKKYPNDNAVSLSFAFILIVNGSILKGFELYKKLSKRYDMDILVVDECISFIDNASKSDKYPQVLLSLSKGLLLYYWKDKKEGEKYISKCYELLDDEIIKKYIFPRFIKKSI